MTEHNRKSLNSEKKYTQLIFKMAAKLSQNQQKNCQKIATLLNSCNEISYIVVITFI